MKIVIHTVFALFLCVIGSAQENPKSADPCGDPSMESMCWAALQGRVKKVISGNSVILQTKSGAKIVRLVCLAEPPIGTAANLASKKILSRLVQGKDVEIWYNNQTEDPSSYILGVLYIREFHMLDVNLVLVQSGLATIMPSPAYSVSTHTKCHLEKAESEARQARRGMWRNK